MKIVLNILIAIFLSNFGVHGASYFEAGVKQYQKHEFESASELLLKVTEQEPNNIAAYYNLGLSAYQIQKYALSLWAFEKAYKLKPYDVQIVEMRSRIRKELKIKSESNDLSKIDTIFCSISSNTWAIITIIFSFFLATLCILKFKFRSFERFRIGNISIICTMTLMLLFLYGAGVSYKFHANSNIAIVQTFVPETSEHNKNHFDIPEGTMGEIIGQTELTITFISEKGLRIELPKNLIRTY